MAQWNTGKKLEVSANYAQGQRCSLETPETPGFIQLTAISLRDIESYHILG